MGFGSLDTLRTFGHLSRQLALHDELSNLLRLHRLVFEWREVVLKLIGWRPVFLVQVVGHLLAAGQERSHIESLLERS